MRQEIPLLKTWIPTRLLNVMQTKLFSSGVLITSSIILGSITTGFFSPVGVEEAYGRELLCKGNIGAITINNLRVPKGYTCQLRGTLVKGLITVEDKAILKTSGARLKGNIRACPGHKILLDSRTHLEGRFLNLPKRLNR